MASSACVYKTEELQFLDGAAMSAYLACTFRSPVRKHADACMLHYVFTMDEATIELF